MNVPTDLLAWQLADSAFPAGSFAHSGGLEAAWQQGAVDAQKLESWLSGQLHAWRHGALTFMLASHRDCQPFEQIDRDCDLFLNNHVANKSSRLQGQALLQAVVRIFCRHATEGNAICDFRARIRQNRSPGHLAPVLGVTMHMLGLGLRGSARLFLFTQLRSMVSAAVRLGIIGPLEGQAIQFELLPEVEDLAASAVAESDQAPFQIAPWPDLLQAGQDRLYTRLFQS